MTRRVKSVHLVLIELESIQFSRRKVDKNHKNPRLIFEILDLKMGTDWLGAL